MLKQAALLTSSSSSLQFPSHCQPVGLPHKLSPIAPSSSLSPPTFFRYVLCECPFQPPLTYLPPLQIINTTVNANFHPMFAAALVGSLVPQSTVGWLVRATTHHTPHTTTLLTIAQQLGLASLLGPALAVLRMPMVAREGTAYYLVRRQFLFKVSAPFCDHFLGPLLSHRRAPPPDSIVLHCCVAW